MKHRLLSSILLVLIAVTAGLALAACQPPQGRVPPTSSEPSLEYSVRIIESCEYIEVWVGYGDSRVYSLTHKGNCKNPIHKHNSSESTVTIVK